MTERAERAPIDDIDAVRDAGAIAHYEDPHYYSYAYRHRLNDIAYYVGLADRCRGPVLEYGVGTGRIALAIARTGRDVVGIDRSKPMLASLRRTLATERLPGRVRIVEGDMRRVRLRNRFSLIIAPFNAILHLYERRDVEAFLARVRAHLAPGGRFVFDFSVPAVGDLARQPERSVRGLRFRHPATGELIRYAERFEYHPLRQLLIVWMDFAPLGVDAEYSVPLSHRQFFPQEMAALLHYNGFSDVRMTEDFTDRAASDDADSIVVSCRASRRGVASPGRRA
jgi:SAM-dependent methyltransferase